MDWITAAGIVGTLTFAIGWVLERVRRRRAEEDYSDIVAIARDTGRREDLALRDLRSLERIRHAARAEYLLGDYGDRTSIELALFAERWLPVLMGLRGTPFAMRGEAEPTMRDAITGAGANERNRPRNPRDAAALADAIRSGVFDSFGRTLAENCDPPAAPGAAS